MKTDVKFALLILALLAIPFVLAMSMGRRMPSDRAIAEGLRRHMTVADLSKLIHAPVVLKDQHKGDPTRPYVFTFSTHISDYQSYSIFSFFFDSKKQLKEVLERHQSPTGESGLRVLPLP